MAVAAANDGFLFGYDFYYLWCGGHLVSQDRDPYDIRELSSCLQSIGWPSSEIPQALTHPPYDFWLYALFGLAPFAMALFLWTVANGVGLPILGRLWLVELGQVKNRFSADTMLAILCFPPVISNLLWGQVNIVHFLGVSFFFVLFRKGHFYRAGLLLSLILAKPQLYLAVLPYVLVLFCRLTTIRTIIGFVLGALAQIFLSWVLFPRGWELYWGRFVSLTAEATGLSGATLAQQLTILTQARWIPLVFCGVGLVLGLISGFKEDRRLTRMPALLNLSLLCAPYNWSHGLIGVLPSFAPLLARISGGAPYRRTFMGILVMAAISVTLSVVPQTQLVWMLLPLAGLFLCRFRSQSHSLEGHFPGREPNN